MPTTMEKIKVRLGDYLTVLTDYHANGSYEKLRDNVTLSDDPDYAVMIRTTNFEKNDFVKDLKYISKHAYSFLKKSRVEPGDILMNKIADPGSSYLMPSLNRPVSLAMNLFLLRTDTTRLDQTYAYYWLKANEPYVKSFACGAATATITKKAVRELELDLPPLPIQQHISTILFSYDELIENSQRRIKILESIARTLYREWFVHFCFPGHENHLRVASPLGEIPQGWEATTLGTHLSALESGKRPKGGIREEANGVPSIGAENINGIGKHEFASEKLVPRDFFEQMRKGVVRDRDVAIYKDGAYIGKSSYFRDGFPHTECCVNEHVFLLRGEGIRLKQNFLYIWLQEPDTVQAIRSKNANAAQPGINQQTLGGLELVLPDEKTAGHFDHLVEPLLAEIINLAKRIQNLRRTRDLLLPRLLSGQIDIEAA